MAREKQCVDDAAEPGRRNSEMVVTASDHARNLVGEDEIAAELEAICDAVHLHTGHDFSRYKQPTLLRRIRRRVSFHRCPTLADYLQVLRDSPVEAEELRRDLLIGVTQFFRDSETFDALANDYFPVILNLAPKTATVRIWVPGCASGEEAYSLAILAEEYLASTKDSRTVQIFATDIDGEVLQAARLGRYPIKIAEAVSAARLERFFFRDGDSYQVKPELRMRCTFTEHSLIRDPPFSSIDLISCRNLLMYLGADLQKTLVPLFHFSLRPGGFLLLGPSETLAGHNELFAVIEKRFRLFQRNDAVARPFIQFPLARRIVTGGVANPIEASCARPAPLLLSHAFERMLIEDYAPASAVVNERGDILYQAGRLGQFLQVVTGQPSHNIAELARGAFRIELQNALEQAIASQRRVFRDGLMLDLGAERHLLRLTVRPLPGLPANSGLYVIVLQPLIPAPWTAEQTAASFGAETVIVEELESELRLLRAELQRSQQNLDTATEELKSSNEELLSTNEELKSANEELQTSQQELQSVNAELERVNSELERRVEELAKSNADLANLYASTEIAALFLDRQLKISHFSPAAGRLLSLIEGDVGRPISDLKQHFVEHDLIADARVVLSSMNPLERQVRTAGAGSWFVLRVLPYRSERGAPTGVAITFVDISALKQAEASVLQRESLLRAITDTAPDPVYLKDRQGRMLIANAATLAVIGRSADAVIGRTDREFYDNPDVASAIMENDRRIMASGVGEVVEEVVADSEGAKTFLSTKVPYRDSNGQIIGLVGISRDITERKRTEEVLRETSLRLQLALHTARAATWERDAHSGKTVWSSNAREILGLPQGTELTRELWESMVHPEDANELRAQIDRALREHCMLDCAYRIISQSSGEVRWINAVGQGIYDESGRLQRVTGLCWDVTERVHREESRQREQERLARTQKLESLSTLARGIAHDFNNLLGAFFGTITLAMDAGRRNDLGSTTAYLEDALKTLGRTRGLTQQLITFARGGEPVRTLTDMVAFTRESAQFSLSGSNLRLNFKASPTLLCCEIDQTQISQVLDNVIANARQAMPGGGELTIELENCEIPCGAGALATGRCIRLTITDNGPGIAPESLSRIFDPFFSTKTGNTGLGLATAHSIVQRHGGRIEVETVVGCGASFRIYLPASETRVGTSSVARQNSVDLSGRRILIMDDEEQILNVSTKLLRRMGAMVTPVSGCESAITEYRTAHASDKPFDLVILDLTIPGEPGGAEVLTQMRALEPQVRAVATSGYADDPIIAQPQRFGFASALPKPFSIQEMESTLHAALEAN